VPAHRSRLGYQNNLVDRKRSSPHALEREQPQRHNGNVNATLPSVSMTTPTSILFVRHSQRAAEAEQDVYRRMLSLGKQRTKRTFAGSSGFISPPGPRKSDLGLHRVQSHLVSHGRWALGGQRRRAGTPGVGCSSGTVAAEWQHTADLSGIAAVRRMALRCLPATPRNDAYSCSPRGRQPRTLEQSLSYTLQIEFASRNRLLSLSDGVSICSTSRLANFLEKCGWYSTYLLDVYREGQSFITIFFHPDETILTDRGI